MFTNKKSLLALSVASAVVLSGCGSDNDNNVPVPPVEPPVTVVVPPEAPLELDLVVNANVVDAATGDVVPAMLSFLTNGEAASNIVDLDGNTLTMVEVDGSLAFTTKEDSTISTITVSVTADGYVGKSFIVDLTTENADIKTVNTLLSLTSKSADGVADASETSSVEGGTTAEAIVVDAKNAAASASATVPAGVELLDANGAKVSGDVTLNVTAASGVSAGAIIPEGINANSDTFEVPVGSVNVLMTNAEGSKVKSFSNPISVTVAIPADTMLDGEAVKTGDMLNLKSHNEDTGEWVNESGKVTVGAFNAEANTYTGSFETNHLTFFASTTSLDVCTNSIGISASGDAVPATGLYVSMSSSDATASGFIPAGASTSQLVSAANASLFGISAGATANVRVYDADNTTWYQSNGEVSICGTVAVELANPTQRVTEDFTVTASCANDAEQSVNLTNAVVRYSLGNKAKTLAASSGNSTFSLANLAEGSSYNVFVNPRVELADGSKAATATITADGTAESLALSVACAESTGSGGS